MARPLTLFRERPRLNLTVVLCGAALVLLALLAWRERWSSDDAYINFRVVDNIHHGLGPVFNPGERVEAYTSALWIAILWFLSAILPFAQVGWIAVGAGMLLSIVGFGAAARGSWLLWREVGRVGVGLPLGLLAVIAVRPVWDFATSGLETSLTFAWLGCSYWAVASALRRPPHRSVWIALLIGLGPLVRPELALYSGGFLVALLLAIRPKRSEAVRLVGWVLLPGLAYQVFRMGYFASLVPNTALAKEAGIAYWERGWQYLKDFVGPYVLLVPFVALGVYVVNEARMATGAARRALLIATCPAACALLNALYIVRMGGDFMHGRMLLPSLFALMLPVTVIPIRRNWAFAAALCVVPWAVVCGTSLRTSYAGTVRNGTAQIGDERGAYVVFTKTPHPITVSDHRAFAFVPYGIALRRYAEAGRRGLVVPYRPLGPGGRLPLVGVPARSAPANVIAVSYPAIGLAAYAAGPRVFVIDPIGLADPLAARTEFGPILLPDGKRFPKRFRAGHEKYLPHAWVVGRFAPASAKTFTGIVVPQADLAAARSALRCGPIRRLLTAVDGPMTPHRFVANIGASFSLTTLRFPANPAAAQRKLCEPHA